MHSREISAYIPGAKYIDAMTCLRKCQLLRKACPRDVMLEAGLCIFIKSHTRERQKISSIFWIFIAHT